MCDSTGFEFSVALRPQRRGAQVMMMNWCLMSSDVMRHIRDKLWPISAEARCNKSLRPRKPEGSRLGRTAQDVHLDSHTAPELWEPRLSCCLTSTEAGWPIRDGDRVGWGRESDWLDRGNRPKKTGETVDRRQNNGSVKALSPRHCPATCALCNCSFNRCAGQNH